MNTRLFLLLAAGLLSALQASAQQPTANLKVATLHPILADLAKQVGGSRVEIIEILKPGSDVHHFEPATRDLATLRGVNLVLAMGKDLESYLGKLTDSLAGKSRIVEVGHDIPSLKMDPSQEVFVCCPHHDHSHIDPHWWHSAENMRRAARILAEVFSEADPAGEDLYEAAAKAAGKRFDELRRWAAKEISRIPRRDRKLVTAHAAFGYFCKEYGFKSLPMLGLSRSDDISAAHIAQATQFIREEGIRACFPEDQANPKVLTEMVRSTGVRLGKALVADGTAKEAHTFETMLAHNVRAIVEALAPPAEAP
jgi:zinc/manganese transport system substrate-binding protein